MFTSWFNDIKLAGKLFTAFTCCLVLCGLACLVAISRMSVISQSTTRLNNEAVRNATLLTDVVSNLKQYRIWQLRYAATKSDGDRKLCEESMSDIASQTKAAIDAYAKNATDRSDIDNAKLVSDEWRDVQAQTPLVVRVCRSGTQAQIDEVISTTSYAPVKKRDYREFFSSALALGQ